jgi:hypothetical protein
MTKIERNLLLEKKLIFFLIKLQFVNLLASMKGFHASEEAFIPQKRTSSTSKHDFFFFFSPLLSFVGRFALPNPDPFPNPDTDPLT